MRCCFFCGALRRPKDIPCSQYCNDGSAPRMNIKLFSYSELSSATENFHIKNKLGQGGFGAVYKGTLRSGERIAIKMLAGDSRQGTKQFLTEIDVLTNVIHTNLIKLIGCCTHDKSRMLVYEYMENNSLDHVLLSRKSIPSKLNWGIRASICIGIAKGLSFLHEELDPPIVHRDIKACNILLDQNYVPKIGDFGLAKFFPDNITHISTGVSGTTGYLAPEYALNGRLTKKADVYSFGILLLEIVSGRSNSRIGLFKMDEDLLDWTWKLYKEGTLMELVDPILTDCKEEEVLRFIKVALFCTQRYVQRRPSMPQVVEMLSRPVWLNEKVLTPPGFIEDPHHFKRGHEATLNAPRDWINELSLMDSTVPVSTATASFSDLSPR